MDQLELSLTLAGLGIAYLAFQDQRKKNKKEEEEKAKDARERRDYVIQKWKLLKRMNEELSTRMRRYIDEHDAFDMPTGDGFTLGTGLEKIEIVKQEIVYDQLLDEFQMLDKHPKINVENLLAQIEIQIAAHAQGLTFIELLEKRTV